MFVVDWHKIDAKRCCLLSNLKMTVKMRLVVCGGWEKAGVGQSGLHLRSVQADQINARRGMGLEGWEVSSYFCKRGKREEIWVSFSTSSTFLKSGCDRDTH